jgi:hypothetical protein
MQLVRGLTRTLSLLVLAYLTLPPLQAQESPAPPATPPVLELGENTVTVRNVPPGGGVVLFGLAHETRQFITTIVRREQILRDADGDGSEVLELAQPLAVTSVWAAVDLQSGAVATVTPAGFPLNEFELRSGAIPAALNRVELDLPMAEVLLVRPGVGAWGRRAGDGGASDRDGDTDGIIRLALAGMWSVGESPPAPERFAPGDIIVVINPQTLGFAVLPVEGPGEGMS